MSFARDLIKKVVIHASKYLPVSKRVMLFDNFRGKGFGDDPRYILEELHGRNPGYRFYWVSDGKEDSLPDYVKPVRYDSPLYFFISARAAVWVSNAKGSWKPYKKKGQFYLQTWHSTLGLKRNEEEAPMLGEDYINAAKRDASLTDLMYSDNDFRFDKYKNHYWYDGEVIKCDVPRIGAMMNRKEEFTSKVRAQYGIPAEDRIMVYMPTFRKERKTDVYVFDYEKLLDALKNRFGTEFIPVGKLHPSMTDKKFVSIPKDAVDATQHTDPNELLAAADVLITDYSASFFDFILLGKPVFLIGVDRDEYMKSDRGLAFSLDELPVEIALNEDELALQIAAFDETEYLAKCEAFRKKVGYVDGGNGASVLADRIEAFLNGKN